MKTIYFDCFCGISGDMVLGALADAGLFEADACIIGDGWTGSVPTVDIGCKGGMGTVLRAKGTAGHASRPMGSDNAIDKLLAVIPYARRIGDGRVGVRRHGDHADLGAGAVVGDGARGNVRGLSRHEPHLHAAGVESDRLGDLSSLAP